MIVLAIDTCETRGSIAVLDDDAVLQVVPHTSTEEYSSWLLPAVDSVLESSSSTLRGIDVFAVVSGPGSFTGVRIGLTTTKAWSEVFSKPIVTVSRLEVVAVQSDRQAQYVASFIDAQRGQIFGALYKRAASGLILIDQEMLATPEVFMEWVDQRTAGSDLAWISTDPHILESQPNFQARAAQRDNIQLVPPILAALLAKMAIQRARKGDVLDALSVDANYVRRSYVEVFQKGPAHGNGK
jgi:tRNA threonylcarbamoyladenosine biosynthesis protein TsaB